MKATRRILTSLFAACLFFLIGTATASAASIYSVTETSATVGTATNLEIEYTVDTAEQTWADADTLTVQLPANFPQWAGLTFTAEYDTDTTNDATGETAITAGAGNGQYTTATDTITIKWDVSTWGAVSNGASTIRILVTAAAIPQYEDATSTFTFGGATADGGDTNPTGTDDVDVNPADAAASLVLTDPTVGAVDTATLTVTIPIDLDLGDYVKFDPRSSAMNTGLVSYNSHTFGGGGTFNCAVASSQIYCTVDAGAITAGTATIVMNNFRPTYASTTNTITSVVVYDNDSSANLATDSSGTTSDTVRKEANATFALGTNSEVGVAGTTTITMTLPTSSLTIATNDTISFTAPDNLDVSGVSFNSHTFTGVGTYSSCTASGQVVTCTASGNTRLSGDLVLDGILSTYASSGRVITDLLVLQDGLSTKVLGGDSSVAVTDTTGGNSSSTDASTFNQITGISVTDYSGGGVKITWTDPSGDDASYIDILRGVSPIPVSGTVYDRVALGVEEYIDTDLEVGDVVTYQLRGTNLSASGDLSAELTYTVGSGATSTSTTSTSTTTTTTTSTETTTETTTTTTSTTDEEPTPTLYTTELSDISGHWAEDEINALVEFGIIEGNPDGTFMPDGSLNRAEASTFLFRVLGLASPSTPTASSFTDVETDVWYAGYVMGLFNLDLIHGYSNSTFLPGNDINRAEFLKMALNVYAYLTGTTIEATEMTDAYEDLDTDAWYAENVSFATEMAFIEGRVCDGGKCFDAEDKISRAEAAVIIYRMFAELL